MLNKFTDRIPNSIALLLPTEIWLLIETFVKENYDLSKRMIYHLLNFPIKEYFIENDENRNNRVISTLYKKPDDTKPIIYYKTLNVKPTRFKFTFLNYYVNNIHTETIILFIKTTRVRNVRPIMTFSWFESRLENYQQEETFHIKLITNATIRNSNGYNSHTSFNVLPLNPPGHFI